MIVSFYDQGTEATFQRLESRDARRLLPIALHQFAARELAMLNATRFVEEKFMKPQDISQSELARALATTYAVINEICRGKRGINAAMALKLARYFKMSPGFWMNLQMTWDLRREWEKQTKKKVN